MIIPPIKSQGIKTKLVPLINDLVIKSGVSMRCNWIEPFFGTGVVGFNSPIQGSHIVGDTNPHIILFYKEIQNGTINESSMRLYLEHEGNLLANAGDNGYDYYKEVKQRFNSYYDPYDFIFLSRAGFNGMMRFNKKGEWNIPFCKKPDRFSSAYITKICNQVKKTRMAIKSKKWIFNNEKFEDNIDKAENGDMIYCDPPYFGRYADYYNGWTEDDEDRLYKMLKRTKAKFILSTWHHNKYRNNTMIDKYWGEFNIVTTEHFYHNAGHIENRNAVTEALVFNFDVQKPLLKKTMKEGSLFLQGAQLELLYPTIN